MSAFRGAPLQIDAATLLRVVAWLQDEGIEMLVGTSSQDTLRLKPDEVVEYLTDPEAFLSRVSGVSLAEYRGFKESWGAIQCHARTRGGLGPRCRKMVANSGDYLRPKEWAEMQKHHPTCSIHGGATLRAMTERPSEE